MAFNSIKDILDKIRSRNPALEKRLEEALAVDAWEKTVGSQIAKHARALKVEDGILWIEVDHSVWRTELHHRKRQILEKLNEAVFPKDAEARETAGKKAKKPRTDTIKDLFLIETKRSNFSGPGGGLNPIRDSKYLKKNKAD